MRNKIILLTAVLGIGPILSAVPSANAAEGTKPRPGVAGEWRLIGQTHAKHSADHDTIVVTAPSIIFAGLNSR